MPKQHIKGGAAVKGKPKHSLDEGRRDGKNGTRTAATVRRLKMYKSRPVRNSKGHMLSNEYQSKALPSTRIQPDRRWFGKCRIGGDMIKLGSSAFQGFGVFACITEFATWKPVHMIVNNSIRLVWLSCHPAV